LSALPGWKHFEPEKREEAQIPADIGDNGAASDGDAVNEIGRLEVASLDGGSIPT